MQKQNTFTFDGTEDIVIEDLNRATITVNVK